MSRPLAILVMVFILILANALEPASTASQLPPLAAATAALPQSFFSAAMPSANSTLSSELAASGLLHLRVKHRPFDGASSIQVTVKNIQVQKAGSPKGLDWITVIKGGRIFDLVGLEQGEGVLGGKTLAEGSYSRVQLDIVSVKVTVKGQKKPAIVGSNRLREIRSFNIDMATVAVLTLDFDAARSLAVAESGEIQFKPVVRLLLRRGALG